MGHHSPRAATLRILLLDRDADARRILRSAVEARIARPVQVVEAADPEEAAPLAAGGAFDAMALDLATCGGADGFARIATLGGAGPAYALGPGSEVREAVEAVRRGAMDFLEKPLDGAAFARRIERQFAGADEEGPGAAFEGMIGGSAAMRALFRQIPRVAGSNAPVFVVGEAATGRGRVAAAVHARSRRWQGPFVAVDCTNPDAGETLLGAEGALVRADGGTLFLRDVDALAQDAQAALVGYLDGGAPSGGAAPRPSVRLVAARRLAPGRAVPDGGRLSPDLFFRLNVLTLVVPALRERADDLPALLEAAMRRHARTRRRRPLRLAAEGAALLRALPFPGNLADLEDLAEGLSRAVAPGGRVGPVEIERALAAKPLAAPPPRPAPGPLPADILPLRVEEDRLIDRALAAFGGNVVAAAAALGISPSTIYRRRRPDAPAFAG